VLVLLVGLLLEVLRLVLELELLLLEELIIEELLVGVEVVELEAPDWQAVPRWQLPERPALTHLHCTYTPVELGWKEFRQLVFERPLQELTCKPKQAGNVGPGVVEELVVEELVVCALELLRELLELLLVIDDETLLLLLDEELLLESKVVDTLLLQTDNSSRNIQLLPLRVAYAFTY
jgi:hypothetical protein